MNMHLLNIILLFVFMEIKFSYNILSNTPPRAATPTFNSERMVLKKKIGKQLSFPTNVTLSASSSKYNSKNKSCRHMSVNNCLEPPEVIIQKDKTLDKMLSSERTLDEIDGKNEILPKLDSSEKEMLKKETSDSENYKIDRLPNNYHPLFPYDLIEIRTKKNEKY